MVERLLAAGAIFVAFALLTYAGPAFAEKRVALVIGNDRYPNLPPEKQLQKAGNDARAVGDALAKIGFIVVRGENLTRQDTFGRLAAFTDQIREGDMALVFFAGHGVALGGNYLLPSDIPMPVQGQESLLRNNAVSEADLIAEIQLKKPGVVVLMIDACRDNPFRQPGATRSLVGQTRGLTGGNDARGVFAVYSAGFGQSALDRLGAADTSPNSVFTRVLVPALARTDADLSNMIIDMRQEVTRLAASGIDPETARPFEQTPAYYDQTNGRVYLVPRSIAVVSKPQTNPQDQPPVLPSRDEITWGFLKDTTDITQLRRFTAEFPASPRRGEAEARISALERERIAALEREASARAPSGGSPAAVAALTPTLGVPDSVRVVTAFYNALSAANGVAATALVIPEKRGKGPFDPAGIAKFYSSLKEPLKILNVEVAGSDLVAVKYQFTRPGGGTCQGDARVSTITTNAGTLIKSISANC